MHIYKKVKGSFAKFDPANTQDQVLIKQYSYLTLYAQWIEVACELSMANIAKLKEQKKIFENQGKNQKRIEILNKVITEYSNSHHYNLKMEYNKFFKAIENIESNKDDKITNMNSNITYFNLLYFNDLNLKLSNEEEEILQLSERAKHNSNKEISKKGNFLIAHEFILDRQKNCNFFNCFTKYCK